jgi:hypothetical protein
MSPVPYADCSSDRSGSCPTGTLGCNCDGYWLGWLNSAAYCGVPLTPAVGWSACDGMMYFSITVHALLNGAQSWVTWPYCASSHTQKLNASDVVSWPWSGASTISVSTEWYGTPSGLK